MRTAEIVAVGTELLLGQIVDTHSATMANILADCGIACQRRATVGDNLDRIVGVLKEALSRAEIVVTIGGLGPTMDDLTRDAIALALGDELVIVPEMEEKLRQYYASHNVTWVESVGRQAQRPSSARLVENPNGTAPGLCCEKNGKVVIALPGPKGEFVPMAKGHVRRILEELQSGEVIHSRVLRICGMGESVVEDKIQDLMHGGNPSVAPYAHPSEVHLRLTARAPSRREADAIIDPMEEKIRAILGSHIYGINETTLEAAIIELLKAGKQTVSVAESLTGGELGGRFSTVPGSSAAFLGGIIAYSDDVKIKVLGVNGETIAAHGAISAECAEEMAARVREKTCASFGIALTGNAGPDSQEGKPVGLVYLAVSDGTKTECTRHQFRGTREDIRRRSTQSALIALRSRLL